MKGTGEAAESLSRAADDEAVLKRCSDSLKLGPDSMADSSPDRASDEKYE